MTTVDRSVNTSDLVVANASHDGLFADALRHNGVVADLTEALTRAETGHDRTRAAEYLLQLVQAEASQVAAHMRVVHGLLGVYRTEDAGASVVSDFEAVAHPARLEESGATNVVPLPVATEKIARVATNGSGVASEAIEISDQALRIAIDDWSLQEKLNADCEQVYHDNERVIIDINQPGMILINGKPELLTVAMSEVLTLIFNRRDKPVPILELMENKLIVANLGNKEARRTRVAGIINALNRASDIRWILRQRQSLDTIFSLADFVWIQLPQSAHLDVAPNQTVAALDAASPPKIDGLSGSGGPTTVAVHTAVTPPTHTPATTPPTRERATAAPIANTSKGTAASSESTSSAASGKPIKSSSRTTRPTVPQTQDKPKRTRRSTATPATTARGNNLRTTKPKALPTGLTTALDSRREKREIARHLAELAAQDNHGLPIVSRGASSRLEPNPTRPDIIAFLKGEGSAPQSYSRKQLQVAWGEIDGLKDKPQGWQQRFASLQSIPPR